jgi:3-phosphoshikimate 1-carboxyvinyltransferase
MLNMGNSGTSTRLFAAAAALGRKKRRFDGDRSLRGRPMRPLLEALGALGAKWEIEGQAGDLPFWIQGPIHGGVARVSGITSQYVSSLLLSCPLAAGNTTIEAENLHEKPYVRMTLWWLDRMGIPYEASPDLGCIHIAGGQRYQAFTQRIPGDFSSATFAAAAAAITGSDVRIDNIDFSDPQGDREVFDILESMGARITRDHDGCRIEGGRELTGAEIDCNNVPDALPALAVAGCAAAGTTILRNVAQARIKETDRIAVMARELSRMGASIEELPDGLVIHRSDLTGAHVDGHDDHRVVMALALAGMIARGQTTIRGAEAAAITYPSFAQDFAAIGARLYRRGELA